MDAPAHIQQELIGCIVAINKIQIKLVEYSSYSPAQDAGQVAARQELEAKLHTLKQRMQALRQTVSSPKVE